MIMEKEIKYTGKKTLLIGFTAIIIIGIVGYLLLGKNVVVKATLGGEVTEVCTVGTVVSEGDVLVKVKGLTGEAVAARATADGKVDKVMTQAGVVIAPKAEVVVLKRK